VRVLHVVVVRVDWCVSIQLMQKYAQSVDSTCACVTAGLMVRVYERDGMPCRGVGRSVIQVTYIT
jgi:hypothetical protein